MIYVVLAFAAGAAVALQGTANSALSRAVGAPSTLLLNATLLFISAVLVLIAIGEHPFRLTAWTAVARQSPGILFGGFCGFVILSVAMYVFPRLGALPAMTLFIAGQLTTAALLGHFGALQLPRQPMSALRLLGIGLVFLGVYLIKK